MILQKYLVVFFESSSLFDGCQHSFAVVKSAKHEHDIQ